MIAERLMATQSRGYSVVLPAIEQEETELAE